MPVQKISEMTRPSASRTAAVKKTATDKLVAAVRTRTATIATLDTTASKLVRAFSDKNKRFTLAQINKVAGSLRVLAKQTEAAYADAHKHMNTALALDLPTNKISTQCEDLATLRGKFALLRQVVAASQRSADGDDTVDVDDSGYVVSADDSDDFLDTLPEDGTTAADNPDPSEDIDSTVIPVGGVTAGRKKADGTGFSTTPTQEKPAGVPDAETVKTNSGDPAAPTISGHGDTSVSTTPTQEKPAGVPAPDGNGGAESPEYSKTDPGASAPTTSLARLRRKADTIDDGSDLSTAADGADPLAPAVPPAPPAPVAAAPDAPVAPPAPAPAAPQTDVVSDDGMDLLSEIDPAADPMLDPSMAADPADPLAVPGLDELAAGDDDGLNVELPDAGFDDMLQDEILSSGEFPADDVDPAAPAAPADPAVTAHASVRKARLQTAARSAGSTHVAAEADALKALIADELR